MNARQAAKQKVEWHTNILEAKADGWISPYMGGKGTGWDCTGRVYGRKPGDHRIYRCWHGGASQSQR